MFLTLMLCICFGTIVNAQTPNPRCSISMGDIGFLSPTPKLYTSSCDIVPEDQSFTIDLNSVNDEVEVTSVTYNTLQSTNIGTVDANNLVYYKDGTLLQVTFKVTDAYSDGVAYFDIAFTYTAKDANDSVLCTKPYTYQY
jgi:hypothetical protein